MYVIKITKNNEAWLVAISPDKEAVLAYFENMSESSKAHAVYFQTDIESFPFAVIQHANTDSDSSSYFEFCSVEELREKTALLKYQKVDNDNHAYFKYYLIDKEYFQEISDENQMIFLRGTGVTNEVLDEPYEISLFHEKIKQCAYNYDIDGLDELFEETKNRAASTLEKEDLAINGYSDLFWQMNYDFACSKLTDAGIHCLLPMVDCMEFLLNEKKWMERSYALLILLEKACEEESENAFSILKDTIEAFENHLVSHPEEKINIHRMASQAYRMMITADSENALLYWQNAVLEIKKALDFAPEKASWSLFFELIYTPFTEDEKINKAQQEAQECFIEEVREIEKQKGAVIAYQIALAYQNLREYLQWRKLETIFPDKTALLWSEKSLDYNPQGLTRIDLYECAEFFYQTGVKLKRIDFLEKTISLYERIMGITDNDTLEVYYIVSLKKEIAEIYLENKSHQLADETIEEARLFYEKHIENIRANTPSNLLHYAEFLEYCFVYQGNITKPSLAELKSIAQEVEIQSEGFLSYPYLLLMRIALFENNEQQAITELTKSLILHESCNDDKINEMLENFNKSQFRKLFNFLKETKLFMEEVSENYYYDPEIKWKNYEQCPEKN
ncbi:hypothetical protein [Flavobacterium sp. HTF]|uniref:hypothetical protein n=1 Tax=Flavobacterium sp. HTF TaxID=2170732 RepID=UPI000D5F53C0|nr:hypothetical protein [Flavobacterium sp. HTF]PWB27641.1 hypothetical protein DCO46_02480 [Flavobacterium sp. HTF]